VLRECAQRQLQEAGPPWVGGPADGRREQVARAFGLQPRAQPLGSTATAPVVRRRRRLRWAAGGHRVTAPGSRGPGAPRFWRASARISRIRRALTSARPPSGTNAALQARSAPAARSRCGRRSLRRKTLTARRASHRSTGQRSGPARARARKSQPRSRGSGDAWSSRFRTYCRSAPPRVTRQLRAPVHCRERPPDARQAARPSSASSSTSWPVCSSRSAHGWPSLNWGARTPRRSR
jgi:hypothetical protein